MGETRQAHETKDRLEIKDRPGSKGGPAKKALGCAQFPDDLEEMTVENPQAWELIDAEAGQYMPRRIRGSFRGRALG